MSAAAPSQPWPEVPRVSRSDRERDQRRRFLIDQVVGESGTEAVRLEGARAADEVITRLMFAAPRECIGVSPAVNSATLQMVAPRNREPTLAMLRSGTEHRWVADGSLARTQAVRRHLEILQSHGETISIAPGITQRMWIFDRRIAFVPLNPHNHSQGALMVQSPPVVACLVSLFHELEEKATPLSTSSPLPRPMQQILTLLAGGAKDDAIARRLDMSARTVRRSVAALMQEADVDSRFQLAIAAVQLGWIEPDDLAGKRRRAAPATHGGHAV